LNTEELLKVCTTANIFARSEANVVHLEIVPGEEMGGGRVKISATSAEMGESLGELDASVEGEGLTIAFNVRFMIDVLSVMDSAQVVLETTSHARPGVLRPLGSDDFVHVIMPMHIRSR
jgi:DNA polymerase-3 subunit beta